MADAQPSRNLWITGPFTDTFFFSFGWLVAFGVFFAIDQSVLHEESRTLAIVAILLFNFLHRHLTFPLVYADPDQFRRRRIAYIALPLFFLAVTLAAFFIAGEPVVESGPVRVRTPDRPSVQHFYFHEAGQESATPNVHLAVRLTGKEASAADMAASLNAGLNGWLSVEAVEDRLRFRLSGPEPGLQVYVGPSSGGPALTEQLGLRPRSWYGFPLYRPLFTLLVILAVVWTIYHTIMQKVGLLRIYSRKAGSGRAWLDKSLILGWFVFLVFHLGSRPEVRQQAAEASTTGGFVRTFLESADAALPFLVWISLAVASLLTLAYVALEIRQRSRFSWPRTLYVISIFGLYATFYYDMITGYAVFGFSHAIEYIAFVNIYSRKKFMDRPAESSLMARAVRRQVLAMMAYGLLLIPAFFLMRWGAPLVLTWYITGSGFLHFIYDGWIWKVRQPGVGTPLGLKYGEASAPAG